MKKFFNLIIIILLLTFAFMCMLHLDSFATIYGKHGDVDHDGKITPEDARLMSRKADNVSDTKKIAVSAADVDLDGKVTSEDARLVLRASVGYKDLYKYAVLKEAYNYKSANYTASKFGFDYDWCMAFVGRCFRSSNCRPKELDMYELSCSAQVYNICSRNPKSFTIVMPASKIKSIHGDMVYNRVRNAKFNMNYVPQPGDVLFIDNRDAWDINTHIACHTGFVTGTEKINGILHVYTIEGNVDGNTRSNRYYSTSRINYKEYVFNYDGTYLLANGTLNKNRQILGYYTPDFY